MTSSFSISLNVVSDSSLCTLPGVFPSNIFRLSTAVVMTEMLVSGNDCSHIWQPQRTYESNQEQKHAKAHKT